MSMNVHFDTLYYYMNSIITITSHKHPEYFVAHIEFVIIEDRPTYKITFHHATSGQAISMFIDIHHNINYNILVIESLISGGN